MKNSQNNLYNEEPVFYCKKCLSLNIKNIDNMDFCDECGSVEIEQSNIFDWEKEYDNKYGNKFLNK